MILSPVTGIDLVGREVSSHLEFQPFYLLFRQHEIKRTILTKFFNECDVLLLSSVKNC